MTTSPTIERLRRARPDESSKPTLDQLRSVVDGLHGCQPLSSISTISGLPEARVLDLVAELGTWLTHVRGGAGVTTSSASDSSQQVLFQNPVKGSKKPSVVVPLGFERRAPHKRDVAKALASIVVARPDDDTLARFIARKYPTKAKVLTFSMVAAVWRFATLKGPDGTSRLEEIDQLNPSNHTLNELLVAAYDLIDLAVRDANAGIATLVAADLSDLGSLRAACAKARWVAEAELGKIERLIEACELRSSAERLLTTELRFLAQRVKALPGRYTIGSIAELNEGQVLRIAQAAGLSIEGTSRAEESEIRGRLKAMGFSSDLDRLVPEAIRAGQVGIIAEFWEAMEARQSGDTDWAQHLTDAFVGAA